MRNAPSRFCLLFALAYAQSEASKQFWDRLHPYFGGELSFVDIRFMGQPILNYPENFWGVGVGANYLYYRDPDDFYAIGPGAQITGSFQFLGPIGTEWMVQVPLYAYARLGAAATPYNHQRLGAGIAVGLRYTAFQLIYTTLSGYVGRLRQGFINPTAMIEMTLNLRRSNPTSVRFYIDILAARRNTEIYGSFDPVPLEYRTVGLGLYYYLSR